MDSLITRVIKGTNETFQSLEQAPLSYTLKLDESLDINNYIESEFNKARELKEKLQMKKR